MEHYKVSILFNEPVIEIINKHLHLPHKMNLVKKGDSSFVTNVDYQISNDLERRFKSIFSDCAVISEENDDRNYDAEHIFVIDPLDGTENFLSGLPIYGTSIAYYRAGEHAESMLYFPKLKEFITDTMPLQEPLMRSRIMSLSSYLNLDEIKEMCPYKNDNPDLSGHIEFRIIGCAVYNLYNVVMGNFLSYSSPRINSWDMLAGINIAIKNGINVLINDEVYRGEFLRADQKYSIKVFG